MSRSRITVTDRRLNVLLIAATAYCSAIVLANVMSVRLVTVFGFEVDAGTLVYPLTFTLRDLVHKAAGRQVARTVVAVGAVLTALAAVLLWGAGQLNGVEGTGPGTEMFGSVLTPVLRITIASIVAQLLAELIDTEVYHRFVQAFGSERQWGRVLTSNMVSVPVDSVVFVLIAFWGVVPASVAWSIIWANIVIKGGTSLLTFPLIYATTDSDEQLPLLTS